MEGKRAAVGWFCPLQGDSTCTVTIMIQPQQAWRAALDTATSSRGSVQGLLQCYRFQELAGQRMRLVN